MKVLHIVPSYFPACHQGGPIFSIHYFNKWLVKKGVDVTVYTTNIDGPSILDVAINQPVDVDGVKVFYFPVTFRPWLYSHKLHLVLAKNIKNFDLVHITSLFLSVSTLGAYYAKRFKIPYVISPRGSLMRTPLTIRGIFRKKIYISLIEKRNLRSAAAIHFTSEAEKDQTSKLRLSFRKTFIIPNSLNTEEFQNYYRFSKLDFRQRLGINNSCKIILFLGRLDPIKGFDILIPAFAEISKKESAAILVIVGGDKRGYRKKIDRLIETYKINKDEIVFTGELLGRDKIIAYRGSEVFVLPSYSENFGMAVAEAMYFGLPVIITKGVGIALNVEKAGAGVIIDRDEKQLAEAVLKILNDFDLSKRMGEAGKNLVEQEFSSEKISNIWVREYERVIKNA